MSDLKPNMVVAIYDDPLTRTRLQCNVILVERAEPQPLNHNLETWLVKSVGISIESEPFKVIVNHKDACEVKEVAHE